MTKHIHRLINLYHELKAKNLAWKAAHQPEQLAVIQERKIAEQALSEELAIKNAQLKHEIYMLKTRQKTELSILKTRSKADLKDYRQYLQALEQLKLNLKTSYAHLPDALVFTIHHHAKNLLNTMWEAENPAEKMLLESQLIQFMATVHEEIRCAEPKSTVGNMPSNTLKLIKQQTYQAQDITNSKQE
jgi:hypothetical protein